MIDINTIQELLVTAAWLVPVITAMVQVIKTAWATLPDRFVPLLSVVVGVVFGIVFIGWGLTGIFAGLIFGLTSSGFYDLGKKTLAGR